jgi:uncharacterized integral membrane protein (TIGR00698 family)
MVAVVERLGRFVGDSADTLDKNPGESTVARQGGVPRETVGARVGRNTLRLIKYSSRWLPGLALCAAVAVLAEELGTVEAHEFGRVWLEPLVLAILLGTCVRTAWSPGRQWSPGIQLSGKTLLEVAIVLLGASLSARTALALGGDLLAAIAGVVVLALAASYGVGRLLGVSHRLATLIACGNSICGNSAIAAVAPVIGASGAEVTASIAFTAVLGVVVVLTLPLLMTLLHLTGLQYGVLAGLTVYAVPQVLAATAPIALQIGTLVKLMRVLMLGPLIVVLSMSSRHAQRSAIDEQLSSGKRRLKMIRKLVPWFIIGFLLMAGLRSANLISEQALTAANLTANILTVIAMAALGLSTNLRDVARAGFRVTTVVCVSILTLGGISLCLIYGLRIG